jgi:hypothetical protein
MKFFLMLQVFMNDRGPINPAFFSVRLKRLEDKPASGLNLTAISQYVTASP